MSKELEIRFQGNKPLNKYREKSEKGRLNRAEKTTPMISMVKSGLSNDHKNPKKDRRYLALNVLLIKFTSAKR
mgnify:CR=1 FL=1